ncbi:MAG: hypothetical protein K8T91_01245 [Planctomycetes bacterium]|nr:hypothetical protein [Planctomycetota bacterium]
MDELHLTIHPLDASATRGATAEVGPLTLTSLQVSPQWAAAMLSLTFEEAVERLSRLPMAYIEPDGSYVWAGAGPPAFRFEGMLHDRGERLSHVELMGHGCHETLLRLIAAVAGEPDHVMIQTVRDGKFFAVAPCYLASGSADL